MADGSKTTPLMAKDYENIPLIADDSENTPLMAEDFSNEEVPEQSERDVQQYESSTTESDKCDTGSVDVAAAVGSDVHNEKPGSSGYSDNRKELSGETEINEIEIAPGKASQGGSQKSIRLERIRPNPPRDSEDLARAAAVASREAAISCRRVMYATYEAISKAQSRVDKALRRAEGAAEPEESNRYHALAATYDNAVRLATTRVRHVDAAAEAAENAATEAVKAADNIAEETNEDSTEVDRSSAADWAAITANKAAIVAYKTEYNAVKAMRRCWEDLDFGNVVPRGLPTRNGEETRCAGRKNAKNIVYFGITILLILGIIILVVALHVENKPEHSEALISVGSLLVIIPLCIFGIQIGWYVYLKRREAKRVNNCNVIWRIDERLRELTNYFENNNITPVHSDDEE